MINQAFRPLQAGGGFSPEDLVVAVVLGQSIIADAISLDCVPGATRGKPTRSQPQAPATEHGLHVSRHLPSAGPPFTPEAG